ncbi:CYTH domain-containing protein [Melissococcus plutonius]|uniref:Adenylate cyclase n=1 Tax=Melissococcus plutonius TaxID=33970 RepID=A0A2Z5Y370_9ENTE|nr:CYTH domain-containing protein [Melissococcus plutonius]BAL62414.1 adenylate cyclase [Melissococcus plutonius DAT561]MCV2498183.1 CYTH domain-containing protein [Melissococcus plutonius]MCV2500896.1 CYTH domain-containing protein [Melissococcus plutonius]MCV2504264.1 CYTH domain-containing protein [Melissococcus plutonius]MCV2506798.1 CYTH domain-containing protein [Melissococcus plutonius]
MSETREIEFKTLINKETFQQLIVHFNITEKQFFIQTNYYFDTKDFHLKKQNMGLRIRCFANKAELTLKLPATSGLLEVTDKLSTQKAKKLLSNDQLPTYGAVYNKLQALNLDARQFHCLGYLTTKRAEKQIAAGLLALDENWYNNHHDYEIEIEVENERTGEKAFNDFLNELNIHKKKTPNKIERMMLTSHFQNLNN